VPPEARRTLALLALLAAGCSRDPPPDPVIAQAVGQFDQEADQFRQRLLQLRAKLPETEKDFRGRTVSDDLDQWVLTQETRSELTRLRQQALETRYLADARQLLTQASKLELVEADRANAISKYWFAHLPAPYWRRYWHSLFESNGVPEDPPDPMLLSIERRMKTALETGDFSAAGIDADELNEVFRESRERATQRIMKMRTAQLKFTPRTTACGRSTPASRNTRAALVRGESVDEFYPEEAIRRLEEGSVVLRARIDRSGCATSVAIVVRSGIPSIDNAALEWFETARFSPAASNGVPIESELTWKIRFVIKQ